MKVLVAYDSHKGTTRAVAERIGLVAQGTTPDVTVSHVRALAPADAAAADVLFLGAWTHGLFIVGVGPSDGAVDWARHMPQLPGTLGAVFCTYDVNPRGTLPALASLLRDKGVDVLGGHASKRRNRLAGVEEFAREVMVQARQRSGTRSSGDRVLRP
ncbi:MAG: hypothetical protein ABI828_01790 [Actinomycetota bacterium]